MNNYFFDEFVCDVYCSHCKRANLPMKINVCELCTMTSENQKLEVPFYFVDMREDKKEENGE